MQSVNILFVCFSNIADCKLNCRPLVRSRVCRGYVVAQGIGNKTVFWGQRFIQYLLSRLSSTACILSWTLSFSSHAFPAGSDSLYSSEQARRKVRCDCSRHTITICSNVRTILDMPHFS